jgi:hypothetical protein
MIYFVKSPAQKRDMDAEFQYFKLYGFFVNNWCNIGILGNLHKSLLWNLWSFQVYFRDLFKRILTKFIFVFFQGYYKFQWIFEV